MTSFADKCTFIATLYDDQTLWSMLDCDLLEAFIVLYCIKRYLIQMTTADNTIHEYGVLDMTQRCYKNCPLCNFSYDYNYVKMTDTILLSSHSDNFKNIKMDESSFITLISFRFLNSNFDNPS